jgi:hypothetical protein
VPEVIAPDLVNGLFEFIGAAATSANVRQILQDKAVRGIHWASTMFFTSWSLWNLAYYPTLGQWVSFAGGAALALTNLTWLALVFRYRR